MADPWPGGAHHLASTTWEGKEVPGAFFCDDLEDAKKHADFECHEARSVAAQTSLELENCYCPNFLMDALATSASR